MPESNYVLKLTLDEALAIRMALTAQIAHLEIVVGAIPADNVEMRKQPIREMDDTIRVLSRLGK